MKIHGCNLFRGIVYCFLPLPLSKASVCCFVLCAATLCLNAEHLLDSAASIRLKAYCAECIVSLTCSRCYTYGSIVIITDIVTIFDKPTSHAAERVYSENCSIILRFSQIYRGELSLTELAGARLFANLIEVTGRYADMVVAERIFNTSGSFTNTMLLLNSVFAKFWYVEIIGSTVVCVFYPGLLDWHGYQIRSVAWASAYDNTTLATERGVASRGDRTSAC